MVTAIALIEADTRRATFRRRCRVFSGQDLEA